MELAILRLLSKHLVTAEGGDEEAGGGGNHHQNWQQSQPRQQAMAAAAAVTLRPLRGRAKVLYLGPLRALVQERLRDWTERFGRAPLG